LGCVFLSFQAASTFPCQLCIGIDIHIQDLSGVSAVDHNLGSTALRMERVVLLYLFDVVFARSKITRC
jgi:hypothetical protein